MRLLGSPRGASLSLRSQASHDPWGRREGREGGSVSFHPDVEGGSIIPVFFYIPIKVRTSLATDEGGEGTQTLTDSQKKREKKRERERERAERKN